MPNWCSTAYAIDGDAKEVKQLYELMKSLEERDNPSVTNGFGTTWLGCLVDALNMVNSNKYAIFAFCNRRVVQRRKHSL